MKKLINICLLMSLLCGCTTPGNSSEYKVDKSREVKTVTVPEFSDSSLNTRVTIGKIKNPDSLKSHLQDSYFIDLVNIKTGKKILSSPLMAANNKVQVNRVWAYKKGALIYGYTQNKAGKKNRLYLLLLIDKDRSHLIYLDHALSSVFFDRKTGLLGWQKTPSTIPKVAFIDVSTGEKLAERTVDYNFFYAKTDGNNSVYLFAINSPGLSVSRYTISDWEKKWTTTIPIKRLTGKSVIVSDKMLHIKDKNIEIKISTDTGKKQILP